MYPNPAAVIPLPPHPSLEQYKKRAKALVKACKSGEPAAIHAWAAASIEGPTSQLEGFIRKRLAKTDSRPGACLARPRTARPQASTRVQELAAIRKTCRRAH